MATADDPGRGAVPFEPTLDAVLAEQALALARTAARLSAGCGRLHALVLHTPLFGAADDEEEATILPGLPDGGLPAAVAPPRDCLSVMQFGVGLPFGIDLPSGDGPDDLPHADPVGEALARGVRVRLLYQDSAVHHRRLVSRLRELADRGGQVRFAAPLPFGLVVVDRSGAVCRLPGTDPLLLRGRRAVGLLGQVFESTWAQALPLDRALPAGRPARSVPGTIGGTIAGPVPGSPSGGITRAVPAAAGASRAGLAPVHESILRLMAEGSTDEAIAHALGVTPRTVARRLREIYRVFGTQSRFRAGVIAKELGIV